MSKNQAAQVEEEAIVGESDQFTESQESDTENAESAPAQVDGNEQDAVQRRINKQVARTYAEKRRADELQKQLDDLKKTSSGIDQAIQSPDSKTPKLEDFDYDEARYTQALIDHVVNPKVDEVVNKVISRQSESAKLQEAEQAQKNFSDRIVELGKSDFDEVADKVPLLPDGVADALVRSENGPELIYHLGTHLDVADKLASMSPSMAMIELGRISANMSAADQVKLSAAPDPIEPLNSGGAIPQDRGPKGATFE